MGLREVLEKMRLVETEPPAQTAAGGKGPPRGAPEGRSAPVVPPESIEDLLRGVPAPPRLDEKALASAAESEDDRIPDFPSIYRAAGITDPAHGFGAHKVLEILSSEEFAGLDRKARAATLSGFLKMNPAGPVPIRDVIQDAVRRDQALDRFEEFLRKKLEARAEEADRENARLQAEMDALARRNREKMEGNRVALEAEQKRLSEWQTRKRIEERRLYEAVEPFVEANPISAAGASEPGAARPAGR